MTCAGIVNPREKGDTDKHLPRERLLTEVDIPLLLAVANSAPEVVGETTGSANADACRSDALLHLLVNQSLDVGLTREHLDTGGRRVDLLGAPWPGDEEEDLENLATARHREDLSHPGADPLKVLWGLDDPDKSETTCRSGSVGIRGNNVAHVRNLVRNTDTSCPEHDGTIGSKIFAAIRTLDVCSSGESAGSRQVGLLVKLLSETGSATHNKRHAGFVLLEDVLAVHGKTLLVSDHGREVEVLFLLTPGDREGVASPEANRWDVQVGMLAGSEGPGASHADVDADCVAWHDLNLGLGATATEVSDNDANKAVETVKSPNDDNTPNHELLLAVLEMDHQASEREQCSQDVEVQESLVESVSDSRWGVQEQEDESTSSNKTADDELAALE